MVVPEDADIDVAEDVRDEHRDIRLQRGEIGAVRDADLQHHDGDDDGDDTIGEGLEASGLHERILRASHRLSH